MFEGTYSPPVYNDLYNFVDGAQDDIFIDSYLSIPNPSPNAAMPILADVSAKIPIPSTSNNTNSDDSTGTGGDVTGVSQNQNGTTVQRKQSKCSAKGTNGNIAKRDMSDSYMESVIRMSRRRRRRLDVREAKRLWHMW